MAPILSCTPAYTFSQKRGTEHMHVGRTWRNECCTSRGSRLMATRMPMNRQKYVHAFSKMWLSGRKQSDVSESLSIVRRSVCMRTAAFMQLWGSTAPLGSPVVPDV